MDGSAEIRISRPVDGQTQLHVDGVEVEVPAGSLAVEVGIAVVAQAAARHGATVATLLIDERESMEWQLLSSPSGQVIEPEPGPDDTRPQPQQRRRWALLVAATLVVVALGGFDFADGAPISPAPPSVGQPAALPTPLGPPSDDAAGPRSGVPLDPGTPSTSAMTAAPPSAQQTTRSQRTTAAKRAQPVRPAAEPTSLRQRAEGQPVRPPPAAVPTSQPRPAATSVAVAAGELVMVLQDGAGLCLTAPLTFAACTGAPGQVWTLGGGALRHGDRCLVAVAEVTLGRCESVADHDWRSGGSGIGRSGLCLERARSGRAAFTQCGSGTPLVPAYRRSPP